MNLTEAKALARSMMVEHGLTEWTFKFDSARRRLGLTSFHTKTISLSKGLTFLNPEAQVRNTILHEIAHVLVGSGHGHDNVWRSKAISIGCNGERTTNAVVKVAPKYTIKCTHCGGTWGAFRKQTLENCWHKQCGKASINQLVLV